MGVCVCIRVSCVGRVRIIMVRFKLKWNANWVRKWKFLCLFFRLTTKRTPNALRLNEIAFEKDVENDKNSIEHWATYNENFCEMNENATPEICNRRKTEMFLNDNVKQDSIRWKWSTETRLFWYQREVKKGRNRQEKKHANITIDL